MSMYRIFRFHVAVCCVACVLTFQAELMDFNPGTWYYLNNLFGESEFYVYTRALLAIISTVTTNAYGDYSYSHITVR